MSEERIVSRRVFISLTAKRLLATIPLLTLIDEEAVATEKIEENDPTAIVLGYVHNANASQELQRLTSYGSTQFCDNCMQYGVTATDGWGTCAIFPGARVAAKGWCKVWVPQSS